MLKIILFKLHRNIIYAVFLCLVITGCDECNPDTQVNNFSATPKEHVYQISGTEVVSALTLQKPFNCDPPQTFTARVIAQVRTASHVNGVTTIDPQAYHEIDTDFVFEKNTSINSPGAKIPIKVPERGGYFITMAIELQDCSNCCNGFSTIDCSSEKINCVNGNCLCKSGKPKLVFERIFKAEERPDNRNLSTNVNLTISNNSLLVRKCYNCSTCLTPCRQ